jgi:hypothetical protein
MMNKKLWLVLMVFILPGCGRLIDWGKSRLYQGSPIAFDHTPVEDYLRWVTAYDQFTTIGSFDALWLTDPVRTVYARENSFREGKSAEHYKAFLRRQLEENNHYISFYVLSSHETPLGDPFSEWKVFLTVDDHVFYPTECKAVDLPYEYKVLLKKRLNLFKESYILTFNAKMADDTPIIAPSTQAVVLHFRRSDKEVTLTWNFDPGSHLRAPHCSGFEPLFVPKAEVNDTYYQEATHE